MSVLSVLRVGGAVLSVLCVGGAVLGVLRVGGAVLSVLRVGGAVLGVFVVGIVALYGILLPTFGDNEALTSYLFAHFNSVWWAFADIRGRRGIDLVLVRPF